MSNAIGADTASPPSRTLHPPESGWGRAAVFTLLVRTVVFVTGLLATTTLFPPTPLGNAPPTAKWVVWDGGAYLWVAQHGYPLSASSPDIRGIAFFPLYPWATRAVSHVTSMPLTWVLVAISNMCALIGFGFFYSWVKNLVNQRAAMVSLLVLATSACAVFFSAALTEGPFFMLVAIALWLLQKKQIWWAAVVCGVATACRPTGAALAITLAMYALFYPRDRAWWGRIGRAALIGLVASSGAIAYEAFLWHRYEKPDIYFHAEDHWAHADAVRLTVEAKHVSRYSLQFFLNRADSPMAWNRLIAIAMAGIIVIGFIKPGPVPRALFILPLVIFLMTALPDRGMRIGSVPRYESAGLPIFVLLGWWLSRIRREGIVMSFLLLQLLLQVYYAELFCRGIWVG
jgi:hypothetical protein